MISESFFTCALSSAGFSELLYCCLSSAKSSLNRKRLVKMETTGDQYRQERVASGEAMRALGIDPYGPNINNKCRDRWQPACNLSWMSLESRFVDGKMGVYPILDRTPDNGPIESGCGRIVLHRDMGNLQFITIRDFTGDIQIALNKKILPERDWKIAKLLDLGDLVYFTGRCAPTKKGEPTVWVTSLGISAKSTAPPPAKHDGMTDIELRYRKRYVDLWSNPETMKLARQRSTIIRGIRMYLQGRDYLEVETPILQTIAGGAAAKPFETHHNALDIPMYMRIAPELYLKRLLVGGLPMVYEIGRNFRNEGLSPKHNPEFTALEAYEAYSDFEQMAEMLEDLIFSLVDEGEANLGERPWRRVSMVDLCKEWFNNTPNAKELWPHEPLVAEAWDTEPTTAEQWHKMYEAVVEPTLTAPTFVTHLPASMVPLAKSKDGLYAECFELVANGQELGCGYSEQTNPQAQIDAFEKQGGEIDWDFIEALRVGMPPAGGLGLGVDRLVMWLTGKQNIKDVILFPTLAPNAKDHKER